MKKIVAIGIAMALVLAGTACSKHTAAPDSPAVKQEALTLTAMPTAAPASDAPASPQSERDRYDIAMTIDTDSCQITEDITLTVHNYSDDPWSGIVIRDYMAVPEMYGEDAPSPEEGISSVIRENGEPLSFAPDEEDASIVRIALDAPLAPNDSAVLRLTFSAAVPHTGDRCLFGSLSSQSDASADSREAARTIELSQCFPVMAIYEGGSWVCEPYFRSGECMYSRCADYDIALSLPDGWVVVATGEEQQVDNGSHTDWHISATQVRDMTLIASNELSVLSEKAGDITINSYYASQGEKNRLQGEESLRIAKEAARFYEQSFGVYPYAELDVVQSCNDVGGIEAPGLIRIARFFAENLGPDGGDTDSRLLGNNVAHETAHQWFYGVVGNDQYRDAWLDEGIASVAALLYAKNSGWGQDYIDERLALIRWLLNENETEARYIDSPYNELKDDYSLTVYERAEEFLYQLSLAMGETEFLTFLSDYYAAFSFQEATTADFLKVLAPAISTNAAAQKLVKENIAAAN